MPNLPVSAIMEQTHPVPNLPVSAVMGQTNPVANLTKFGYLTG
jgi:hypothetical protein